jgi:MFS family permease
VRIRRGHGDRVTFTDVLRVGEYRALWVADAQSLAGDYLARVALSVLVFTETGSTALTALAYAVTLLPAFAGGALLSGLADRYPRRTVMISCDLLRAALLALMSLRIVPLVAVGGLLVVAVLVGPLFNAARTATLPQVLHGEHFVVGQALRAITSQLAQVGGFALGGLVVAAVGARTGLAIDSGTFVLSALIIRRGVRARPAPAAPRRAGSYFGSLREGFRFIMHNRVLRLLLAFGWLAAFYIAPAGLAAPYAADIGAGSVAVGLLLAAMPAGTALGAWALVRLVPAGRRERAIGPLAIGAALALTACFLRPGLVISLFLWFCCGLCCAYQVIAAASFVQYTPDDQRGRALGLAASGVTAVQGLGIMTFGWIASHLGAAEAIGLAGAVAGVAAVALTVNSGLRTRAHAAGGANPPSYVPS